MVLALLGQVPLTWFLVEAGRQKASLPSPSAIPRQTRLALVPAPKPDKPKDKPTGQVVSSS